jgi:protein-S-isoprenylcysteine O-methyltransferase Ste14
MFNWLAFIIWTVLFSVFLLGFLFYKQKPEWKSAGMAQGFLIALFAEMFGIPLTIFILSNIFGMSDIAGTNNLRVLLLGVNPLQLIFVISAFILIVMGFLIIGIGWHRIYNAKNELITDGIYGYVRHPQYLGFFVVTLGLVVWWPTILILIMWPILCIMYYFLARREEKVMLKEFGSQYIEYKQRVGMFIPAFKSA